MLGNLSIVHVMLLLVVAVLIFGTGRLKNLGRDLGGAINGFKQAMREGEQAANASPVPPPAPVAAQHISPPPAPAVDVSKVQAQDTHHQA